jgi:hypothetical protein
MGDAPYRTTNIDQDTRKQPKTDRFCVRCQRDIRPGTAARVVHLVDGGPFALHPGDEDKYPPNSPGDLGAWLVGPDCAETIGLEWTRAEF